MLYVFKRLFLLIPVLFGVFTITFFLIHMIPGDPVEIMLGDYASQADRASLRKELGLDQPLSTQYFTQLRNVMHFNFGSSLHSKKPVATEILARVPASFELGFAALFLAIVIGIPLGVGAAIKESSWIDHFVLSGSVLGLSFPALWSGPLLIWLFAIELDWLPMGERGTLWHLILPSISLSVGIIALVTRMTRSSMLDVLREDYIKVARAKGLPPIRIYFHHALTNAIIPILTILGLIMGALLTGAVIVETIFDWPGIGLLLYQSIQNRDYPVVQGCVFFVSVVYVMANFLTDLSYAYFNPKIRQM
ncbi:MAG: ABC transporter permease [Bdellovibrionaceae bacterium]|nr:ABC transporter permease [Pseudobdellovibrionaceae bacterium]